MIKAVNRFMESKYNAASAIIVLLFISFGRFIMEMTQIGKMDQVTCIRAFMGYLVFYVSMYFFFATLLSILLKRPFEKIANATSVGLLFGLLPPIIMFLSGSDYFPYIYFDEFTPFFVSSKQPFSETLTLWGLVFLTGGFVFLLTRSYLRALFGFIGAWVIIQIIMSFLWIILKLKIPSVNDAAVWNNIINIGLASLIYLFHRGKPLLASFYRSNHALPFCMLAFCGSAWAGQGLIGGIGKAVIVFFWFEVIIIHNDYYDSVEDGHAGRKYATTSDDVMWSSFFLLSLLVALSYKFMLFSIIMGFGLIAGFMYHHPLMRLKERFCLSYKLVGLWALTAFIAGTLTERGFEKTIPLLIPAILVFGGGTLISIPKDWKDVVSDRIAKIPTYYVVLTHRGIDEFTVHLRIVACVTIGLIIPPLALSVWQGFSPVVAALWVTSVLPAVSLIYIKNRKLAVETMMWLVSLYLLTLAFVLNSVAPHVRELL